MDKYIEIVKNIVNHDTEEEWFQFKDLLYGFYNHNQLSQILRQLI